MAAPPSSPALLCRNKLSLWPGSDPAAETGSVRFAVIGDMGTGETRNMK